MTTVPPRPPAGDLSTAPVEPAARLDRARALLARGERGAARGLLTPLAAEGGPAARAALAALAALDESEGRPEEAVARWQTILADQIDDDEAWAHLHRVRRDLRAPLPPAGPGPAAPTLDSGVGVRLDRFEIVGELGRGTFATVYRARDRGLQLDLALKVLHPRGGSGANRSRGDQGFFAEARRVAGLRHPGIVAIYDIDEQARTLVMELVPGGTLRDRLRRGDAGPEPGDLDPVELEALARRLLGALDHLHAHTIVHGDLSPRNVLLRVPGDPVVIDFGGALLGDPGDQPAGTPLYLAPEQFAGAPISAAADLFAAGAILWEAAAGHPMRTREDLMAGRTGPRPLPAPTLAIIPPPLAKLIAALTTPAPEPRVAATAAALAAL